MAEARRTTILQPAEQKRHSQKDKMKRQRAMYQMKEQDKTPEKQLNEVQRGNLPEERIQNNDSEDDPGPRKKNGGKHREDARNV